MTFFKAVLSCLLAIGIYNFADSAMSLYLKGGVYACTADKDELPTHIQQQCKRLTRGQWWHN
jgi:hypothetical protein